MKGLLYESSFPNRRKREEIIRKSSKTNKYYLYELQKISLGPAAFDSEAPRKQIIRQIGI
jgi:hypothetical protein